jgi:hypothetical protein
VKKLSAKKGRPCDYSLQKSVKKRLGERSSRKSNENSVKEVEFADTLARNCDRKDDLSILLPKNL